MKGRVPLLACIVSIGFALAMAYLAWWGLYSVSRAYLFYLIPTFVWSYNALISWRMYRAYRRSGGNRGSTGPGTSTIHTTFPSGTIITSSAIASTIYASPIFSVGTREGTKLRKVDEPYRAWKWAVLEMPFPTAGGKVIFTPLNHDHPSYGVVDAATCGRAIGMFAAYQGEVPNHRFDPDTCSCGFYGFKTKEQALDMIAGGLSLMWPSTVFPNSYLYVMLEVEFYGKVVVCRHGFRAEKQRVLGMHVPDTEKGRWWYSAHGQPEVEWQWFKVDDTFVTKELF